MQDLMRIVTHDWAVHKWRFHAVDYSWFPLQPLNHLTAKDSILLQVMNFQHFRRQQQRETQSGDPTKAAVFRFQVTPPEQDYSRCPFFFQVLCSPQDKKLCMQKNLSEITIRIHYEALCSSYNLQSVRRSWIQTNLRLNFESPSERSLWNNSCHERRGQR